MSITRRQFAFAGLGAATLASLGLWGLNITRSRPSTLGPVAGRTFVPNEFGGAQNVELMAQTAHVAMSDVDGQFQAWWANWRATSGEGEVLGSARGSARASITFRNSLGIIETQRLLGIDGGETLDVAPGENFKFATDLRMRRGTRFQLRFWGRFPEGMNYAHMQADYANGDIFRYGEDIEDLTGGAEPFLNTYEGAFDTFAPIAIMALTDRPTIGISGDSRDVGLGDRPFGPLGHIGQFARLLGDRLAYHNVSIPGGLASEFVRPELTARRRELLSFASHLALGLGANDAVAMNIPASEVLGGLREIARSIGKPTIGKTIDPWTDMNGGGNGSDNVRPNDGNRIELNALLRDVPDDFIAVFDPAKVLEYPQGRWIGTGAVTDWVHESNLGNAYAAAASGFDFSIFDDAEPVQALF